MKLEREIKNKWIESLTFKKNNLKIWEKIKKKLIINKIEL